MAVNRFLAKARGLSEEDIQRIDDIHNHLEFIMGMKGGEEIEH